MGLDLWFCDDVSRILASKAQAVARMPADEYRRGCEETLSDIAAAFGLPAPVNGSGRGEWVPAPPVIEGVYHTRRE